MLCGSSGRSHSEPTMNAYDSLDQRYREIAVYKSTSNLLGWDQETLMPPKAAAYRAQQVGALAGLSHRLGTSADVGEWLAECEGTPPASADENEAAIRLANIRCWRYDYDRATKLPAKLVEEIARTTSLAREPWTEARRESEFGKFAPWLEKILSLAREQAECWGYTTCAYDAMLEAYEPNARVANLAPVFSELQKALTPLLPRLQEATGNAPTQLGGHYPEAAQLEFSQRILGAMGFDFTAGRLDKTVHPFCTDVGPKDTRLTTRYDVADFASSLASSMHEAGHGLYDQGLPSEHFGTPAGTYVSLAIHESQSRLWENQVGRSRDFWRHWYPIAQRQFPELSRPLDELWLLINRVRPSHIRVEADEATYNLHIILRFEMEQRLVSGELSVADLPAAWNQRFEELFGIAVPDDARGCLQDVHWSLGVFGYFPTYTLGTLNAAQLFAAAQKQIPGLNDDLQAAEYGRLLSWLREKIHQHGRRYSADELMMQATGETTQARYFLDYLKAKYKV